MSLLAKFAFVVVANIPNHAGHAAEERPGRRGCQFVAEAPAPLRVRLFDPSTLYRSRWRATGEVSAAYAAMLAALR